MVLEGADKDRALETIMVAQTAGEDPPYHPEPGKILAALEKVAVVLIPKFDPGSGLCSYKCPLLLNGASKHTNDGYYEWGCVCDWIGRDTDTAHPHPGKDCLAYKEKE